MVRVLEKFKDPRWQKKRLEILNRDNWECKLCGDSESTLHVHHKRYITGRDIWDYPDNLLITLCEECHEIERIIWGDMTDLLEMLKEKFMGPSAKKITQGFHALEIVEPAETHASALKWFLSSFKDQEELVRRYVKYIET